VHLLLALSSPAIFSRLFNVYISNDIILHAGSSRNGNGVNGGDVISCGSFSSCQNGGGRGGSGNQDSYAGDYGNGGNGGQVDGAPNPFSATGGYSFGGDGGINPRSAKPSVISVRGTLK
jgi:hypothetical protein